MIRTKTTKEIILQDAHFLLWKPALGGVRCECFKEEPDPNRICRKCYGTGLEGGGYVTDVKPVHAREASFEETKGVEVEVDEINRSGALEVFDDLVSLHFECDFHYHVYPGCLFKLEGRFWKVTSVEEEEEDEDNDGLPLPTRWGVTARSLEVFEGAYLFLQDVKEEE
jgi:hypothetical protein